MEDLVDLVVEKFEKKYHKYQKKLVKKVVKKILVKALPKFMAKSAAKKIPVAGLACGGFFAIGKLCQGNWKGACMEMASGASSLVPGAGTAASLAIDAI